MDSPTSNRIILARHGETFFNREIRIMGRHDSPLTPEGMRIAAEVARLLDGEAITAVYSSPLGRAVMSAKIYAQDSGVPIALTEAMAELACGAWEGSLRFAVKPGPGLLRGDWDDRPPGGESYRDAEIRVGNFISQIRWNREADTILVVGHAGVNRVFLKLWLELEPDDAVRLGCPHDTVYILEGRNRVSTRSVARGDSAGPLIEPE